MKRLILLLTLAVATTAHASWYDDYDAGLIAAKKGQWSAVVQKMTAAIKGNAKEGDRVRTYGVITINYHPYYYRGAAYIQLGKYEEGIADLEKTSGPGPENLGSIDALMDRAKKLAAADSEPEPTPAPVQPRPEPIRPPVTQTTAPTPTPVVPQIDAALRQRASTALGNARQKIAAAQQRRATASPQFTQANSIFNDAASRFGSARNNDDYNSVIQQAENAGYLAELAMPPNVPAPNIPSTTTPSPLVPKPIAATTQVIDENADDVKHALELYFAGEFKDAADEFEKLTRAMPKNAWIYAFLGASQYSLYAFETEESYKKAALNSFRKAKQLRKWNGGLPSKYFSKRIREAFNDQG